MSSQNVEPKGKLKRLRTVRTQNISCGGVTVPAQQNAAGVCTRGELL